VGVAGIAYLNSRPLLAGLQAGIAAEFLYRFELAEPGSCAERLARGEVAAALVPVATLPFLPGVRVETGLGVACRGAVKSVLLISRVPIERIATLAVHRASRSSVVLARLLLAERYGVHPEVTMADPPLAGMLDHADAAVIIGDPAMRERRRTGMVELDLGKAWVEWTGLPFVFAVWAVAAAAPVALESLLTQSLAYAQEHWRELVPTWAAAHALPEPAVQEYLASTLHFTLDEHDRAGMAEFLARAASAGVLHRPAGGVVVPNPLDTNS
jgi:predicted solute-binding protein